VLSLLSRRVCAVLFVPLLVALAAACSDSGSVYSDPEPQVRTSYSNYATAVSLKDGDTASGLVSAATLDHYSDLRDLALSASRAQLAKHPVVDQLAVLSMRANVPVRTLRTGSPRDVVAAAVQAQVISGGGAGTTSLSDVDVTGDAATANLGIGDGSQTVRLAFRKEGETWKVDLTALLPTAEASLKQALEREKLTAGEMLTTVMTQRVGAAKAAKLWTPLGR
jgi:hypothetical protein